MSKYDKWYIITYAYAYAYTYALLLESAKQIANLQKLNYFCKIQLFSKNVCKKKCPKNDKIYIFEKPLTMPFKICKKFCKILNNLIFNETKNVQISFDRLFAKNLQFFSQNLCNPFPYVIGFPIS